MGFRRERFRRRVREEIRNVLRRRIGATSFTTLKYEVSKKFSGGFTQQELAQFIRWCDDVTSERVGKVKYYKLYKPETHKK